MRLIGGIPAGVAGRAKVACALALVVLLTGCSRQLLGSLDEMAANQVVSALRLEGVSADKALEGEKGWRVTVPDDQFAEAVQVLERRNLPSPQFQGLGQVFKKESLVSTPTEERARLMYAMSQELEHSLTEIDGVLAARVHPVILAQDPLSPKRGAATASVLIKYRVGTDVGGREAMVRSLVAAGIEGLNADDVRVVMVPAEVRPVSQERVGAEPAGERSPGRASALWRNGLPLPFLYGLGLAALALALVCVVVLLRRRGETPSMLQGRWAQTVNSLFLEREPASTVGRERRSTQP